MTSNSTKVWMPLYVADYLADTSRLTTEQHGAYLLLILDYWRNGPLPDDDFMLARVCRMSPDAWSMLGASVRNFFVKNEDGSLHHKRIDAELVRSQHLKERAIAGAKATNEKRWGSPESSHSESHSDEQASRPAIAKSSLNRRTSPSPSPVLKTNTQTNPEGFSLSRDSKSKQTVKTAEDEIERVRLAYPIKKAPAAARKAIAKAIGRLRAQGEVDPASVLIERIATWKAQRERDGAAGKFVSHCPYPATWFNGECYAEESLLLSHQEADLAKAGWTVMRGAA
jgi:uncharacterized protein YdaU (DUF1376 family)